MHIHLLDDLKVLWHNQLSKALARLKNVIRSWYDRTKLALIQQEPAIHGVIFQWTGASLLGICIDENWTNTSLDFQKW